MKGSFTGMIFFNIGRNSFRGCTKMTGYLDCSELSVINENAFYECGIEGLINTNYLTINSAAFAYCENLKFVDLSYVDEIDDNAFSFCFSAHFVNFNDIKKIGKFSFRQCSNITGKVHLDSIESIGEGAFAEDYQIECFVLSCETVEIESGAFMRNISFILYYPLKLNQNILDGNDNDHYFSVYYYGTDPSPELSAEEHTLYESAHRIYVLCNYTYSSFYGQQVTFLCNIQRKNSVRMNFPKLLFSYILIYSQTTHKA